MRFAGNTESRWLLEGQADVVVTDGFTGNVALKALEGRSHDPRLAPLRLEASVRGRLGGLLIRPRRGGSGRGSTRRQCSGAYLLGLHAASW